MSMTVVTTAYLSDMKTKIARLYQDDGSVWVEAVIDILGLEPSVADGQLAYVKHIIDCDCLADADRRMSQWASTISQGELARAAESHEPIPMLDEMTFIYEIAKAVQYGNEEIYVISATYEDAYDGTR